MQCMICLGINLSCPVLREIILMFLMSNLILRVVPLIKSHKPDQIKIVKWRHLLWEYIVRKMSDLFSYVRKERDQLVSFLRVSVDAGWNGETDMMSGNFWFQWWVSFSSRRLAHMSVLFFKFGYTRQFGCTMFMLRVTQVYSLRLFDTMDNLWK